MLQPKRHDYISDIDEIIADAKAGRMFILVDDEDRENEGDLVIPAIHCDAEAINFMAKHGRGLICLSLTQDHCEQLGLEFQQKRNTSRHDTGFMTSIEAREGVTTGISAADRALTVEVAIKQDAVANDLTTPGHVFPLRAKDGGVLVRAGHTEAAVDIARMAGLVPAGVICEIMNDDGTMARLPDLISFAQYHNLKIGAIADLIQYRRRTERYIDRVMESSMHSIHGGDFKMYVYVNTLHYSEHIALVKGDLSTGGPVPVRMHSLDVLSDVLGDSHGKAGLLQSAMEAIAKNDRGVVVLIREAMPKALSNSVRRKQGVPVDEVVLRDYGIGAQILRDLGVREMELMTNSNYNIVGLEGYGLSVSSIRRIDIDEA